MGKLKGAWKVASAGLTGVAAGAGYGTNRQKGHSVPRSVAAGTALGATGAGFGFTKKKALIGAGTFAGGSEAYSHITGPLHTRRSSHTGIDNKEQQHWNG